MSFLATPSPSAHPLLLATYKKTSRRKLRPDVEQETNEFVFTTKCGSSAWVVAHRYQANAVVDVKDMP